MNIYIKGVDLKTFTIRRLRKLSLFNKLFPLGTGGSPEYSFRVWAKHLSKLRSNGITEVPEIVAELGPGSSLGAGIAALLSGSKSYYALDVQNYISKEELLRDFDSMVKIFKERRITGEIFPSDLLPDTQLEISLNEERIVSIRKDIEENGANGKYIKYFAPWNDDKLVKYGTVDFIFSQCVLEHVDGLEDCYTSMNKLMKKDGYTSHLVDFQCHAFTEKWNGHWAFSEKQWMFVKGSNSWAINRLPASKHIEFIGKANFSTIEFFRRKEKIELGISRAMLDNEFSYLTDEDLETTFIDILLKK